jgi:hypothetical protein
MVPAAPPGKSGAMANVTGAGGCGLGIRVGAGIAVTARDGAGAVVETVGGDCAAGDTETTRLAASGVFAAGGTASIPAAPQPDSMVTDRISRASRRPQRMRPMQRIRSALPETVVPDANSVARGQCTVLIAVEIATMNRMVMYAWRLPEGILRRRRGWRTWRRLVGHVGATVGARAGYRPPIVIRDRGTTVG